MNAQAEFLKKRFYDTNEDKSIIEILSNLKSSMDMVYMRLSYTNEEVLIDSLIYELKALNMKYQYYFRLAKDKGILSKGLHFA